MWWAHNLHSWSRNSAAINISIDGAEDVDLYSDETKS